MSSQQVEFINRERELEIILNAIYEWDSRQALFIQGPGGVGKTRVLREVYRRLLEDLPQPSESDLRIRPVKIGLLMAITGSGWGQQYIAGCQAMARELGIKLIQADGQNDLEKMAVEFDGLVSQEVDAIIIDLGRGARLQEAVEKAIRKGSKIVVIGCDLPVEDLIEVAQDDYDLAFRSLSALFDDIDGRGKIAICWNPGPAPLEMRKQILDNMLHRYPDVRVIAEIRTEANACEEVERLLDQHPDLTAIWASTGEYALRVMEAFARKRRTDVPLYSIDFDDRIREFMFESGSPWRLTVVSDPEEIGRIMVRIALQAVYGEATRQHYTVPVSTVTQQLLRSIPTEEPLSKNYIPSWGSSAMGWTSWMRDLYTRHVQDPTVSPRPYRDLFKLDRKGQRWLILNLIDLDDIRLQSPQDISLMIIDQLGYEHFKPYLNGLWELQQLERVHSDRLPEQKRIVDRLFLECLSGVSFGHRTVILCDTTDAAKTSQGREALEYLMRLGQYLSNVVLLVSGRDSGDWYSRFSKSEPIRAQLLLIAPLASEASAKYFNRKQELLHVSLDTEVGKKILFLAGGLPILIDLATYWLSRDIPLSWLTEEKLEILKSLPSNEIKNRQQVFEIHLIRHIEQTRSLLDRLVLTLAWVNPIDIKLCAELLDLSVEDASKLFADVQGISFIKPLPNGQIKLHDYMQDMVLRYVWPNMEEERKQRDSERAVRYFEHQLSELKQQLRVLREIRRGPTTDIQLPTDAFLKGEVAEREYWQLGVQLIRHSLVTNINNGTSAFCSLFDEATQAYRFLTRGTLLAEVQPYIGQLSLRETCEVGARQITHWMDTGEYLKAGELAQGILVKEGLDPGQRVDLLTKLANCNMLSGHLREAVDQLDEALSICRENLDMYRWIGIVQNTLGRAHRMMGYIDIALDNYMSALDKASDRAQIASILNNIGYIWSLQGRYEGAVEYCERALSIREELDLPREVGGSFSTIGEIYRNWSKYDQAMTYYDKALAVFEPENDPLWLARLYSYRGAIYRLQGRLDLAENELSRSIAFKVRVEQPWAYHVLACVFWDRGELEKALQYLQLSNQIAQEVNDLHNQVNNVVGFAEIYYEQWMKSGKGNQELPAQIQNKFEEFKVLVGQGYPHHFGRMQRVLADLAYDEGRLGEALESYSEAYALLGSRTGGYGRRTFSDELQVLRRRIERLAKEDPSKALEWYQKLHECWSDDKRLVAQRDELVSMCELGLIEVKLHLL